VVPLDPHYGMGDALPCPHPTRPLAQMAQLFIKALRPDPVRGMLGRRGNGMLLVCWYIRYRF